MARTSWLLGAFDTDGEVISRGELAGRQIGFTRAYRLSIVLVSDFAISIAFGEGYPKDLVICAAMPLSHF